MLEYLMAIASSKVEALVELMNQEMFRCSAPFFGINVYDINEPHLDEFNSRLSRAGSRFAELPGFSLYFRALSDYGTRKRIIGIGRYEEEIDPQRYRDTISENQEFLRDWRALCEVMENYDFFTSKEIG
jgi:hypothetical protein